jgi:hypothetical protein
MSRKLLADTSAWIEHLKGTTEKVSQAAQDENIELVTHPMILAELALGGITNNSEVMKNLRELKALGTVSDLELLEFIDTRGIRGKGIGYVDVNLLVSCVLEDAGLLSFDRKLNETAESAGIKRW